MLTRIQPVLHTLYHWLHPSQAKRLRLLMGITVVGLLFSLILYGVGVALEHQVLTLCKQTRSLQEENQNLQVQLDQQKSYANVAKPSQAAKGLQAPSETVEVAERTPPEQIVQQILTDPPAQQAEQTAVGY